MVETLPATPGPRNITTRFVSNSAAFSSPLTGATQISARNGGVWEITYQMPPMSRKQSGAWLSLMTKLNGPGAAVYVGPRASNVIDYYVAGANYRNDESATLDLDFIGTDYKLRWIDVPTPLVKGASQTGSSLITDGWSEGDGLNAGDYLCFENGTFRELHIVTADGFADSNGDLTLSIAPNIRTSPSNNVAVTIISPTGEFVAADQTQANEVFNGAQGYRDITVKFREFLR